MPRRAAKHEDADSFGQRLKLFRKQRGFAQADLAKQVGSGHEHEEVMPQSAAAARFATVLSVSADELLGITLGHNEASDGVPSRRFLRRLKLIETLPRRDQDALLGMIDAVLAARGSAA